MEEIGMEIKANTSLDQENKAQTTIILLSLFYLNKRPQLLTSVAGKLQELLPGTRHQGEGTLLARTKYLRQFLEQALARYLERVGE